MKSTFAASTSSEAPGTAPAVSWSLPPERPSLESAGVHIWRAALSTTAARLQSLSRTLSADERERAARFHFQKDHDYYIVARGVLRSILGRYLETRPAELRFRYGPYGKPELAPGGGSADALRFNLSHSHGIALYAVTSGREVGIDVEYIRADFASDEIAGRFFSLREVARLRALPENLRREAFFNCWTRKEAYIKARGEGLSLPLDRFDVSLAPGEPAALLRTIGDPHEAARWSLRELPAGRGYVAAVAVEGSAGRLNLWQCPE